MVKSTAANSLINFLVWRDILFLDSIIIVFNYGPTTRAHDAAVISVFSSFSADAPRISMSNWAIDLTIIHTLVTNKFNLNYRQQYNHCRS